MKKSIIIPALFSMVLSSCTINIFSNGDDSSSSNEYSSNESSKNDDMNIVPDGYDLLYWSDEFSGTALGNHWEAMIGDGSNYGNYRWGNNEEQFYKKENAFVYNDQLHIVAIRERNVTEKEEVYEYSSARIVTKGKVFTTYGYFVARIKLPVGTGLWPAFWMLPENNYQHRWWPDSGEIDIMEARGRIPNAFGSTIHTANANHQDIFRSKEYNFNNSDISEYHDYGVLWDENGFKFYIDGEMFFEVTPSQYQNNNAFYSDNSPQAPFDQPFHIIFNLAIGGVYDNGRSVDEDFQEAEMLVDYVRIYKKD